MDIFGIGIQEFLVIFLICLIIFGPNKLPEIGKALGKAIKEFKNSIKEIGSENEKGGEEG
jgi:sec-independent protein translocase protein TatA